MRTFSERIKSLRKAKGYSREELARLLWVSPKTVECWENGTAAPASMDVIEMSRLFNVSTDGIIGDDMAGLAKLPVIEEELILTNSSDKKKKVDKNLFCGICWSAAAVCNFISLVVGKNVGMSAILYVDVICAAGHFKKFEDSRRKSWTEIDFLGKKGYTNNTYIRNNYRR